MPSLRLSLLTAALSATAYAGSVTLVNKCSFGFTAVNDRSQAGQTPYTLAAGASSSPVEYNADALHVRAYTDDISADLAFEVLQGTNGQVFYDVVEGVNGNPFGGVFTLSSSSSSCPGITGNDDFSGTDVTSHSCDGGADFTFTVCV